MKPRNKPNVPKVPHDPFPNQPTGDENLPSPADQATEAAWRPYDSSTGHARPEGDLDKEGRRTERDDDEKGTNVRDLKQRGAEPRR